MYDAIINKNFFVNNEIWKYCTKYSSKSCNTIKNIIKDTHNINGYNMLSSNIIHNIIEMILKIQKSKICVDLGTYTGVSAMVMAKFSQKHAKIYSIDLPTQNGAQIAKKHISNSIYKRKIHIIQQDIKVAIHYLPNNIDLIFLDADKKNIQLYFDSLINKLSNKGLIIVDDVLWYGQVIDKTKTNSIRASIISFNKYINNKPNLKNIILPIRNGLNIIYKNK